MQREEGESDDAFAARQKSLQGQIDLITTVVNNIDQLTIGAVSDADKKTGLVDLGVKPLAGTPLAKLLGQVQDAKSDFGGFMQPRQFGLAQHYGANRQGQHAAVDGRAANLPRAS